MQNEHLSKIVSAIENTLNKTIVELLGEIFDIFKDDRELYSILLGENEKNEFSRNLYSLKSITLKMNRNYCISSAMVEKWTWPMRFFSGGCTRVDEEFLSGMLNATTLHVAEFVEKILLSINNDISLLYISFQLLAMLVSEKG
jgi:hypothetical protein